MAAFHEIQFPPQISYGSSGGPMRRTEVVELASGSEERNSPWVNSKRRYDVAHGVRHLDQVGELIEFFEARKAKLYGFRYKDWSDYKSCAFSQAISNLDQLIGTGNSSNTVFQLVKTYEDAAGSWVRSIKKPVSGSVLISVNGTAKTAGVHFNVDYTTGIVTFTTGNEPPTGELVKAGYEFDVPVRFDTDSLDLNLATWEAGQLGNIPLVEIRV